MENEKMSETAVLYKQYIDAIQALYNRAKDKIKSSEAGAISLEYYKRKALVDVLINQGLSATYTDKNGTKYSGIEAIAHAEMEEQAFISRDGIMQYLTEASQHIGNFGEHYDVVFDALRKQTEAIAQICGRTLPMDGRTINAELFFAKQCFSQEQIMYINCDSKQFK